MILRIVYYALCSLVVADVLISYAPSLHDHPAVHFIHRLSTPLLAPFRRLLGPVSVSGDVSFDFSPLLCLVAINLGYFLLQALKINF